MAKEKILRVYSRDGKEFGHLMHKTIGWCKACQEVCERYVVRWADGRITKPCPRGMKAFRGHERIL
jgi:hypothetical protein